jgi:hypothetical protein
MKVFIKNTVVIATLFFFILLTLAFGQNNMSSGYLEETSLENYWGTEGPEHFNSLTNFLQARLSEIEDKIDALQTSIANGSSEGDFKVKYKRAEEKVAALNDIFPEGLAAKFDRGSHGRRILESKKNGKALGLSSLLKAL